VWVRKSGHQETVQACRTSHSPGECPWKELLTEPRDGSYPSIAIEAQEQP
jgi:hypothetical protein